MEKTAKNPRNGARAADAAPAAEARAERLGKLVTALKPAIPPLMLAPRPKATLAKATLTKGRAASQPTKVDLTKQAVTAKRRHAGAAVAAVADGGGGPVAKKPIRRQIRLEIRPLIRLGTMVAQKLLSQPKQRHPLDLAHRGW